MSGTQAFPRRPWAGHSAMVGSSPNRNLTVFWQRFSLKVVFFPLVACGLFSTALQSSLLFAFPSSSFPLPQANQLSHPHLLSSLGHLTDCLDLPWAPLHCSPGHCSLRITTIMITTEGLAQACDPSTQEGVLSSALC